MGEQDRASSRLRVHAWVPRLRDAGFDVRVFPYHDEGGGKGGLLHRSPRLSAAWAASSLWRALEEEASHGGWIVFQEVLPPPRVLRAIQARGARIGYDFSDPVHLANGPDHRAPHRLLHNTITLPRFRAMLKTAKWTTVENDLLCDLARSAGASVDVMRGPVDSDLYRPAERENEARPVVGWAGSGGTLPLLRPILSVLSELKHEGLDFSLCVFGVRGPVQVPGVDVQVVPWTQAAEPKVIAGFNIGINHMPMNDWTRYRGGAKLIFYQSCGVPTVSSPTGIGDQVVDPGVTGFLASNREEWKDGVRRLLTDPALRVQIGAQSRERAVSRYSYRAYLPRLTELLSAP